MSLSRTATIYSFSNEVAPEAHFPLPAGLLRNRGGQRMGVTRVFLRRQAPGLQWLLLILLSVLMAGIFTLARLPAALLMGPMAAAILLSTSGVSLRVPPFFHVASQAVIGTMIARILTPSILVSLRTEGGILLGVVLATVAASSFLGWLLGRLRVFQGSTAIWGLSPGAASVMMVMAEAYGADARLVAFMQYLRVAVVVTVASLVVRFRLSLPPATPGGGGWLASVSLGPFGETLLVAGAGAVAGRLLKVPAGSMLVPMILGAFLQAGGFLSITLPPELLAVSYALLGWGIGLGFTRPILRHALRALPRMLLAIFALVAFSGALAFLLVTVLGMDSLTAFLATSPGGMDSVAIIAASGAPVDTSFIMALQTMRFLAVLVVGPILSRFLADRMAVVPPPLSPVSSPPDPVLERVREEEDELD